MSHKEQFLRYLTLGWSPLPLQERGKLPDHSVLPKVWDEGEEREKATWKPYQAQAATEEEIEGWLQARPHLNVGIVTGAVSGLIVLDLDGAAAMAEAQERGLPETPMATTGKGLHVYFAHPGGKVGNRANMLEAVPGFDLRGDGGYVVAPPSIHPSGAAYTWLTAPEDTPLAPVPAWLLALLAPAPQPEELQLVGAGPVTPSVAVRVNGHAKRQEATRIEQRQAAYLAHAVEAELDTLRRTQSGSRNAQLNRTAFALGQLVATGVVDQGEIERALEGAAQALGLGAVEARKTIASGLRSGQAQPRELPDFADLAESGSPSTPAAKGGTTDEGSKQREQEAQVTCLIRLGEAASLFHTPTGERYARYQVGSRQETAQIAHPKSPFRLWLGRRFFQETGKPPSQTTMAQALQHLEQVALYDGPSREVFTRVGYVGNTIYLNVGDEAGQVIEISADGWEVRNDAPVVFRTTRNGEALPLPERGGSIEALRPLLNLPDETTWKLCVGWLVAALSPWGPYAHIAPSGEQGTGKSSLLRVLRAFTDPAKAEENSDPKSVDDFMVTCLNNHVVSYDNLSSLPDWLSDALCRLATGAGLTKRMLYSDMDEIVIDAARPVILNGISEVITRPDLLERTITFELPRINVQQRLTERVFGQQLAQVAPSVFGALLDGVVMALRRRDGVRLPRLPRMADFVVWVEAAAPAFGWEEGAFLTAFEANLLNKDEQALEADEVAETLVAWSQFKLPQVGHEIEVTMKQLLAELAVLRLAGNDPNAMAAAPLGNRLPTEWPDSPRGLIARLGRARPVLRKFGVEYRRGGRRSQGQLYILRRIEAGH